MCRMKNRPKPAGFTLVELLIVSAIIAVISLAIFSSFSSGLRIWKRVSQPIAEEDASFFFERLGGELRQAVLIRDAGFQGMEGRMEFPSLIFSKRMNKRTVGKLAYTFDPEKGVISRSAADYSAMFTGASPPPAAVLNRVSRARFSFYRFNPETRRFEWLDSLTTGEMPLAVRVELQLKGSSDKEVIVRTFSIPVSRKPNGQ
jgi:prepilin-type N-terminal cleavage/methylation domain-containing protein